MNSAADRQTGGVDPDAALVDISHLPLRECLEGDDSSLARALRRLTRKMESDEEYSAAFGNFADPDPGPDPDADHKPSRVATPQP